MMNKKEYLLSDLLDFIIFTFLPSIIVIIQILDFSNFLFGYGFDMTRLPAFVWTFVNKFVLIIALLASYRLHYCKYHKRMIYLILIVQTIGHFDTYFVNYILEVNVLMLILLYESFKALLQVIKIFITQSRTFRKIKTLYYAAKRRRSQQLR